MEWFPVWFYIAGSVLVWLSVIENAIRHEVSTPIFIVASLLCLIWPIFVAMAVVRAIKNGAR